MTEGEIENVASDKGAGLRLQWMDVLKCVAIFLVVWSHCIQYFTTGDIAAKPVFRVIHSIFMPLLMSIAGFFYAITARQRFHIAILHKARQLLLPVISWALLVAIVMVVANGDGLSMLKWNFKYWLLYGLWFLKSAFICSILAYFPLLMYRKRKPWATLLACVLTLVISQLGMPDMNGMVLNLEYMYPCFLVGMIICWLREKIGRFSLPLIIASGALYIILLFFFDSHMFNHTYYSLDGLDAIKSDPLYYVWMRIYRITMGIAGSFFMITLFEYLFADRCCNRMTQLLAECGKCTLGIYILHVFMMEIPEVRRLNFDNLDFYTFNFVVTPLLAAVIVAACTGIVKALRLNGWLSCVLLGAAIPKLTFGRKRENAVKA